MRGIEIICSLVFILIFSACSTTYENSSTGFLGGFSEKELEPGIWRVHFLGNGYTSHETAQTYWLYRSANLAIEKGFDGFEIMSPMPLTRSDEKYVKLAHSGGAVIVVPAGGGGGGSQVEGDIRLLKRPFTPVAPKIFDAAALKTTLDPIVLGEKCAMGNVCPHAHHYLYPADAPATK